MSADESNLAFAGEMRSENFAHIAASKEKMSHKPACVDVDTQTVNHPHVHFMMEGFLKAIFAAALIVCTGFSASAHAADSVVGAWRLIAVTEEETANKVVHKPLGEHPLGLIIFTADGHMSFIMADPSRKAAAAPKATDAEAAALYRTMAAYSRKYRLDGDKLTNHPEIAWNQAWNGTDQRRTVAISDNTLRVTTAPFVSPFYDKEIVSMLVFEREP